MNNFYNAEYLQERLAAVTEENERLKEICERQANMSRCLVDMALELDAVKAERDKLRAVVSGVSV